MSQKSQQVINRQPDHNELDSNTGKYNFKGLSRPDGTKQVFKSIHISLGSFSLKNVSLTLYMHRITVGGGGNFKCPIPGL